jgi:hypothetical protein
MATKAWQYTYPAPVSAVVPAAAMAAQAVRKKILQQTPTSLVAKGSWWRLIGYPVTIKVNVWGADGAAQVAVEASSFGWGPIVGGTVQNEASQFVGHLTRILQDWSVRAAAAGQPGVPGQ